MPQVSSYVPASFVFPEGDNDFDGFKSLIKGLSRTDTILWCSRLNLMLANPHLDERKKQQYAVSLFFDSTETARLNQFAAQHDNARVFFRYQLLEVIRWTSLLATDDLADGKTFEDPDVRRRFARATLIASELWGARVFADGLPETGNVREDRRNATTTFRAATESVTPDIVRVLARSESFYRGTFQNHYPNFDREFSNAAGVTVAQYLAFLFALSIHFGNVAPETANQNPGLFRIDAARESLPEELRTPFDRYIALETQTADDLRAGFWRDVTELNASPMEPLNDRHLRERPILRTLDGRAIILDLAFFGEKASVGPLFAIAKSLTEPSKANTLFSAFGDAFEDYVNGILRAMFPASPLLAKRLICNPFGRKAGQRVEIADACLDEVADVVLFETKGTFVREDATHSFEDYTKALRQKYSATRPAEKGDRPIKGVAQLARSIRDIANGDLIPDEPSWAAVKIVYPVMVVYDAALDRPGHSEFFDDEFEATLQPDTKFANGYMKVGAFSVSPLTVMRVADLENLESSVENFRFVDFLKDYASTFTPSGRPNVHDFMIVMQATKRYKFIESKELAGRATRALEGAWRMTFPNTPLPST